MYGKIPSGQLTADGQIIVRSIYAGQALPDTDIGEGDEIVGITRFGTALVLPRLQVRSAVSGVTHIGLTLDAISSTASGASVALYDYLGCAKRAGGWAAKMVSRAGGASWWRDDILTHHRPRPSAVRAGLQPAMRWLHGADGGDALPSATVRS